MSSGVTKLREEQQGHAGSASLVGPGAGPVAQAPSLLLQNPAAAFPHPKPASSCTQSLLQEWMEALVPSERFGVVKLQAVWECRKKEQEDKGESLRQLNAILGNRLRATGLAACQ